MLQPYQLTAAVVGGLVITIKYAFAFLGSTEAIAFPSTCHIMLPGIGRGKYSDEKSPQLYNSGELVMMTMRCVGNSSHMNC